MSVHLATRFYVHRLYAGGFSVSCPVTEGQKRVRLKVVSCDNATGGKVLLYLHGGGGVFARSSSCISVLKNLAYFTRASVVLVDYSRGPRHGFYDSLEDCNTALEWCHANLHLFGGEIRQLTVSGDSAGGTLATALCAYCRDNGGPAVHRQVLLNPLTDAAGQTPSRKLFAQGFGLAEKRIDFFRSKWYERGPAGTASYHAPLLLEDLSGLPPMLVITSEYDLLRDEGEDYARSMHSAGTRT
jgi:acetyl esterase